MFIIPNSPHLRVVEALLQMMSGSMATTNCGWHSACHARRENGNEEGQSRESTRMHHCRPFRPQRTEAPTFPELPTEKRG